ncbi:MAG: transporter, family, galactose:H+ symporter [Thermoleophilales bacterium]|nr:transporter, family, galactose:H+ symporter [Thermoleophilales bacterium]
MSSAAGRRKLLVWAASAATGGLLFGYHIGVIGGALLFIRRDFGLGGFEQGVLVSVLPLGAGAGGITAARLADAVGRRRTLIAAAVVFLVATTITVVAQSYGVLVAGRAITGVAVGMASSTIPVYLSEIAPPEARGRLVTMNQLMVTSGILLAVCVDLIFAGSGSWRAMLGVGLVPAAVLLAGMLRAPETPAWLDEHGRSDQARQVVLQIADRATADRALEDLRRAREQQRGQVGVRELLGGAARPALVVGVTLAAIQQFSGINAVIYYAPTILERTGLSASNSILYSLIIAAMNVGATVASMRLVDSRGRRPLLLTSMAAMSISLVLLGLTYVLDLGSAGSGLSLACLVVYIAAFGVGLGPVFWILIAEIFPPGARAAGASAATAANWFWNFLVGLLFLPVANAIGTGQTFWIFAAACAFGLVFVRRYVPETKGRSLTEIGADVRARWQRGRGHAAVPS